MLLATQPGVRTPEGTTRAFSTPSLGEGASAPEGASAAEAALPDELLALALELAADLVTDASVGDLFGLASPAVVSVLLVSCVWYDAYAFHMHAACFAHVC